MLRRVNKHDLPSPQPTCAMLCNPSLNWPYLPAPPPLSSLFSFASFVLSSPTRGVAYDLGYFPPPEVSMNYRAERREKRGERKMALHLPLNAIDRANRPPAYYLTVQDGLILLSSALWTIAYILYVRQGLLDRSYGMPIVPL